MELVQLIYISEAKEELSDEELDKILESSVRHNTVQEVTGILLFWCGKFMQVIEGPDAAINETLKRICNDTRHHQIYVISRCSVLERQFPAWHMGFHQVTKLDEEAHPAFIPLLIDGFDAKRIGAESGLATDLLKQFCKNL